MDFIINISALTKEERETFEAAWHKLMCETDSSVQASWNGDEYTFKNYHEASDEFAQALASFLKSVSPKIETHKRRTMGFGEDRSRWSHENGRFVENYVESF
jgi:DNA polymerase sigma